MKLQDRVILITGASQGLGAEAARACAEAGATVVLVGRHQKKLEKVYDTIVSAGYPEPFAVVFDLMAAEEQEYERLAKAVAEATGGRLNGIIHSAAYFYALSPLEFQTVALLEALRARGRERLRPVRRGAAHVHRRTGDHGS